MAGPTTDIIKQTSDIKFVDTFLEMINKSKCSVTKNGDFIINFENEKNLQDYKGILNNFFTGPSINYYSVIDDKIQIYNRSVQDMMAQGEKFGGYQSQLQINFQKLK